jgi:hypothetical protein
MTRFRCWRPDHGETRKDADDVTAVDERDAAERYAASKFTSGDPFALLLVRVAAWGSGSCNAFDVEVSVETVPSFCGSKPRRVA